MFINKSISYFYEYYLNPKYGSNKYKLPTHVNFPITDNCNSKCRMCNVWKDKSENELSSIEIEKLFSNKLFFKVKHLGISGGEPTLRKDLIDCIVAILNALPKLKSLSITSHGFHPTKWERHLPKIMAICAERKVFFKLNVSVDGIGELHEEVRRIDGGWKKVIETINIAKANKVPIQIQCTVSKHNIFGVNEVLHFAKINNIEYIFRKATSINRLYNQEITNEFFNSNQEDSFLADFIESDSVSKTTLNPNRRLFYKDLAKRLTTGDKRKSPCHFQYNGVLISAHGEMYHCSIDEKSLGDCRIRDPYEIYFNENSLAQLDNLVNNICPNCIHDQSGAWNPFVMIWEVVKVKMKPLNMLITLFDFGFKNIKFTLGFSNKNLSVSNNLDKKTVHIIGAYGGEHVGDSAILGGVILRILERHDDVKQINVYSKRKDRTEFWVKGLDFKTDFKLVVKDYSEINYLKISLKDKLVWAGGPIMEMPVDLFEHYETITSFVKKGIDFEIIGCGWGPFKTKYSKNKAFNILNKANYVEMRDKYDLPVNYTLKQDPAFDYLFQEYDTNEKWSWSKTKIDDFIKKVKITPNAKLILLNLRPIWDKYNKSKMSSGDIDNHVINEVFKTIKKLPKDYKMVSVPFNTDHYGFSDMEPALMLRDLCEKEKINNFHIFDRELNARDMRYLLNNFDAGICMRFHACIFLKSMKIPVYGIDYTAGEIGKVGGLFKSFNDDNWINIMELKEDNLNKFINKQ